MLFQSGYIILLAWVLSFTEATASDANLTHLFCKFDQHTLAEEAFDFALENNLLSRLPLVVLVSSYGWPPADDLLWLNKQPWPAYVSTKVPFKGSHSEPWGNVGQEDATFLNFVVRFWSELPERIALVHGHEYAWHQRGFSMAYILRNICLRAKYFSLNAVPSVLQHWLKLARINLQLQSSLMHLLLRELSEPLDLSGRISDPAHTDRCCSQFIVHRDVIHTHSKEFYATLLRFMTNPKRLRRNIERSPDGKPIPGRRPTDVYFLEEMWHHLFNASQLTQKTLYGNTLSQSLESNVTLVVDPSMSMSNVVGCPSPLCKASPSCHAEVVKETRLAGKSAGVVSPRAYAKYWDDLRRKLNPKKRNPKAVHFYPKGQ